MEILRNSAWSSTAFFLTSPLDNKFEQESSIRYKLASAPIEDSDQPAQARSLIRVFDGGSMCSQGSNVSTGRKLTL